LYPRRGDSQGSLLSKFSATTTGFDASLGYKKIFKKKLVKECKWSHFPESALKEACLLFLIEELACFIVKRLWCCIRSGLPFL
jgi:hypothetical protein